MADILFNCPTCNNSLAIDEAGVNLMIKCPHCDTSIRVPTPILRFACPSCNAALCIPSTKNPSSINCPTCNHTFSVSSTIDQQRPTTKQCIGCHSAIENDAVICVSCGINQQTGAKVQTKLKLRNMETDPQPEQQWNNPATTRYRKQKETTFKDKCINLLQQGVKLVIVLGIGTYLFINRSEITNVVMDQYSKLITHDAPPPPTNAMPQHTSSPYSRSEPIADKHDSSADAANPQQDASQNKPSPSGLFLDKIVWGMSKKDVKTFEENGGSLLNSEKPDVLTYQATKFDKTCLIAYHFTNDLFTGKDIAFALPGRKDLIYFRDSDAYLQEYKRLQAMLKVKYGNFIEQRQDIDVTDAKAQYLLKIKKQQQQVDYAKEEINALTIKQSDESKLHFAAYHQSQNLKIEKGKPAHGYYGLTKEIVDFESVQRKQMDRQKEYLNDEITKLNKITANKPLEGWESYTSTYTASDCKISLQCSRAFDGVRIILKYRSLVPNSVRSNTDDL